MRKFRSVIGMNARRNDPPLTPAEVIARLDALHVGKPENGLLYVTGRHVPVPARHAA